MKLFFMEVLVSICNMLTCLEYLLLLYIFVTLPLIPFVSLIVSLIKFGEWYCFETWFSEHKGEYQNVVYYRGHPLELFKRGKRKDEEVSN